jgi:hypothetical protein
MRIFADKSSSESREKLKEEIRSIFEESIKNNSNPKYTVLCKMKFFVMENLILIIIGSIGLYIICYFLYKTYKSMIHRSKAYEIYSEIEKELKSSTKGDDFNLESGFTENEIVDKYKSGFSEKYFKSYILPLIDNFRKSGKKVKKFNERQHGKDVVKWQFIG